MLEALTTDLVSPSAWSAAPKIFSYPQAARPITPSFGVLRKRIVIRLPPNPSRMTHCCRRWSCDCQIILRCKIFYLERPS